MGRKKYEYQQTEVPTLRLALPFSKLAAFPEVAQAYTILSLKGRKKSDLIRTSIRYYDHFYGCNDDIRKAESVLNVARHSMDLYNINSKESLEKLLSTSLKTKKFKDIEEKSLHLIEVRKMLCGFPMGNEEAEAMHTRLFEMTMNERLLFISKAVMAYVMDGNDQESFDMLANSFVKDCIIDYHNNPEILDSLTIILNLN